MEKALKNTPKKGLYIGEIVQESLNGKSYTRVLNEIFARLQLQKKTFLVTPNPEFLVFASLNPWFTDILSKADIAIPDGVAFFWAGEVRKGRNPLSRLVIGFRVGLRVIFKGWGRKRVTGTDLVEILCQKAAQKGKSVYFLGGKPGIASLALKKMKEKYPGLEGWAEEGPPDPQDKGRNKEIPAVEVWVEKINQNQPDFLFVAFGMGKQEGFIWENWPRLKVGLACGVGGAFDYLSGQVKRAPLWLRKAGFEWLYRLIKEPWRLFRQASLWKFVFWVIKGELN